jgi:hydroxymethylpyrimidine/phosphomethylpyrimidine kinase
MWKRELLEPHNSVLRAEPSSVILRCPHFLQSYKTDFALKLQDFFLFQKQRFTEIAERGVSSSVSKITAPALYLRHLFV